MAGKPPHWKERNGRYSARIVIPDRLRPYLEDRRELEIQLGGDRRMALRNHAAAVASLQRQIGIARQKHQAATGKQEKSAPYPLTVQQIAVRDYQSLIAFDAEIRAHDHRYAQSDPDPIYEAHPFRDGFAGKLSDDELEELVGPRIERFRLAGNTEANKGTPEWRILAQALCAASYEAIARQYERNDGDFTGQPSHPLLANAAEADEELDPITFDDVIDEEEKRRARGKDAKPLPARTIKKYRDHCKAFANWRKSANILTVTETEGKNWIEALQHSEERGNRTIGAMLQNVRTVLNWARQRDKANVLPSGNPLAGIKRPDYTSAPSHLRPFTIEEAKLVLSAARKEQRAIFRWIPWLCAYSGMRISEAGNLRKEDFFEIEGRWFWRVTTAGARTLKNASSERRIPVHKALMDEGLVAFVNVSKPGRLFLGETKDTVEIQPRVREWVRELIPYQARPELAPNHGWRHLFEDLCRRDNVPEEARNYITGRRNGRSQELYGRSDVMLPGLADAMDRIQPIPLSSG